MLLLTGASGFVGGHLLKALLSEGLKVRCLVRPTSKGRGMLPAQVDQVFGDILDRESLAKALIGVDTVIQLVGIIEERAEATFRAVHVQGSKNVVDEAVKAGVSKYIHMSALGSREAALSSYHRTKWMAEEQLRASGLNHTIFRPAIIFGPGDGFINLLVGMVVRLPLVPIIGTGEYLFQPIYIDDVVTCFLEAVKNPADIQGSYELAGPERLTFNRIVEIIKQTLGVKKGVIHIPMKIMKPLVFVLERILPRPPVTSEQLTMLEEGNVCDISPMKKVFPVRLTRLEEGIKGYLGE
ncbi:MAG: complex I NDUFA9 subunit family protein [Thermodesulfobacteriota bacterium]